MNAPVVDAEGYLVDPGDWSEAWALATARAEGVGLTRDYWAVMHFIRTYYEERALPPDARFVMRHLAETLGAPRNRLFDLFSYGYAGQACRFAGTRQPRIWSTA